LHIELQAGLHLQNPKVRENWKTILPKAGAKEPQLLYFIWLA
jgi:hypothetical protein